VDLLLNWLMQGALVAIAAAAGLRVIPASRARARCGFLWAAYLVILALPAVPLVLAASTVETAVVDRGPVPPAPLIPLPVHWWTSSAVTLGLWMIWSAIQAARLGASALAVRDVRRQSRPCPSDVLARLPYWSQVQSNGRLVPVVLTDRVRTAAVLGCGAPMVALTPRLIPQLSATDLDRVLVHEWAHVQRRDDIAQLVQRFIRVLAGWHPAIWWLDRRLDFEREAACDDLVVRVTGSAKGYATCLATLASMPKPRVRPLVALAAVGPSRLRRRVVRILAAPVHTTDRSSGMATAAAGGSVLACAMVAASLPVAAFAVPIATEPTRPVPAATSLVNTEAPETSRSPERTTGRSRSTRPVARQAGALLLGSPAMPPPMPSSPPPSPSDPSLDARILTPALTGSTPVSFEPPIDSSTTSTSVASQTPAGVKPRQAWDHAADAGVAIGRASQGAGVATAGFFSRLAKKIAGSF
jgi:beta-lactamase regulating signal transducer with metallopeptidase domain